MSERDMGRDAGGPPAGALSNQWGGQRRERPLRIFALLLGLFFVAFAVWSWATPLFGAPDEPVQVIKAAALVRGELRGTPVAGPGSAETVVTVPRLYARAGTVPGCFAFRPDVPASCAPNLSGGVTPTRVLIYDGRYPPLYYAVVGLPSLATSSAGGVYMMRLVSALLSAGFLALAATVILVWSRSRMLLAGLGLAATPTLFFLGGAVNPSSLEVSSAICCWCSLLILALEHGGKKRDGAPPLPLLLSATGSACVMVLTRGLSPLWLAMIGVTVFCLAPGRVIALLRLAKVRVGAVAVLVCTVAAFAWIVTQHTLDVQASPVGPAAGSSELGILADVLGRTPQFFTEMIGRFGWLDVPAPLATYVIWCLGLVAVAGAAILLVRRQQLAVWLGVVAATVVVPVLISSSQARHSGFVWQGRDSLPFAVGVPLVGAALLGASSRVSSGGAKPSRFVAVVLFGAALAQFFALTGALRRNAVGLSGPFDYLHGPWGPPLGALAVTLVALAVWIVLPVVLSRVAARSSFGRLDAQALPTVPVTTDAQALPAAQGPGPLLRSEAPMLRRDRPGGSLGSRR
ncbi:MAG: DUF2142 domain-containing protein [Acidimicrobiales bacterium]